MQSKRIATTNRPHERTEFYDDERPKGFGARAGKESVWLTINGYGIAAQSERSALIRPGQSHHKESNPAARIIFAPPEAPCPLPGPALEEHAEPAALTFAGVSSVSRRFDPVRALSLCCVNRSIWPFATAARPAHTKATAHALFIS